MGKLFELDYDSLSIYIDIVNILVRSIWIEMLYDNVFIGLEQNSRFRSVRCFIFDMFGFNW